MLYLLQSWIDSLSLFKPKNFKLFALVTLKTIGQTYWLLLKYFWWVALCMIALFIFMLKCFWWVQLGKIGLHIWCPQSNVRELVGYLGFCIWLVIVALCVRPSVAKKNPIYFSKYFFYMPVIIVCLLPINALRYLLELNVPDRLGLIISVCFVVQLLFIYFMLDMSLGVKNALKSFLFAFKMFWYNAPAFFLIIGLWLLLFILRMQISMELVGSGWLHRYSSQYYFYMLYLFDYFIAIPIIVSIIGNFYIKRLHEQPQLYFKQPKEQE